MSRDILDLIDNAILGATSPDAMRWTPDAEKAAEQRPPCRCLLCMPQDEVRAAIARLDAWVLSRESPFAVGGPIAPSTRPAPDLVTPSVRRSVPAP